MPAGHQEAARTPLTSLPDLSAGAQAIIAQLKGGTGVVSRLAALGFTPGVEVTVIRNSGRGPLIVSLRGTSVALGRGEAARVFVADASDGPR